MWQICAPQWTGLGWVLVEGFHLPAEGRFNRAAAINRAAHVAGPPDSDWDVLVVADADILVPDMSQVDAATLIAWRTGGIVLPYDHRRMVTPEATRQIVQGVTVDLKACSRPDRNTGHCSSVQVVPRALFDGVDGFDERFVGYGGEDEAFVAACATFGPPVDRTDGPVYHLHHPRSPERNPLDPGWQANRDRAAAYRAAEGDRTEMHRLLTR